VCVCVIFFYEARLFQKKFFLFSMTYFLLLLLRFVLGRYFIEVIDHRHEILRLFRYYLTLQTTIDIYNGRASLQGITKSWGQVRVGVKNIRDPEALKVIHTNRCGTSKKN